MASRIEGRLSPNRFRLLGEWFLAVLGFSLLGMVIRLALFNNGWGEISFNPWPDLPGMVVISALGWIIPGFIGPLWLILLSLVLSLVYRQRMFLSIAVATALVSGLFWPKVFWAMMSV